MKRFIFTTVVLSLMITSSCSKDKIIPTDVLSDIYYDMYIIDQAIANNSTLMQAADTLLIYESIFNRYGYTTDEYLNTVNRYMERPDRFVKVFEAAKDRLDKEKERLQVLNDRIETRKITHRNFRDSLSRRWEKKTSSNYEKAVYTFFFIPDSTFSIIPPEDSLAPERIYSRLDLYDTIPYLEKDFNFPYYEKEVAERSSLVLKTDNKSAIKKKNDQIRK